MPPSIAEGLLWYVIFVGSTVCHEASHAWSALKLGDDTASRGGQVSLDPVPHIRREPIGMVVMPLLTWFLGGWMMGWASAPYDPDWARRFPKRAGLMALAGPAANLALVLVAGLLLRVGLEWHLFARPFSIKMSAIAIAADGNVWIGAAAQVLSIVFSLNLLLAVFNLLPVPPLDGSSAPLVLLPENAARRYFDFVRSPVLRLVGFMLIVRGLGGFFQPVLLSVVPLIYPAAAA